MANYRTRSIASIETTAAEWLARCDAGLDSNAEAQFRRWLAEDPRHANAWQELETIWRTLDLPRRSGEAGRMIGELHTRKRRRRNVLVGSVAAFALATTAAIVIILHPFSTEAARPSGSTSAGNVVVSMPERRQLPDGSVVELKTGAQIDVRFSATERDVTLLRGEAHFQVTKDPSRPFVVRTGVANVRAVGTAFAVGLVSDAVTVLVTEGTVAVGLQTAATKSSVPVPAGHALIVPNPTSLDSALHVESVTVAEIEQRLGWRASRFEFSHTPLSDLVAAFNRDGRIKLEIADIPLASMRMSGALRTDRVEDLIRLLKDHYSVWVERRGPDTVVLHRAQ